MNTAGLCIKLIRFLLIMLMFVAVSACSTASSERTSMIGIKSAKNVAVVWFNGPENLRLEITDRFTAALKDLGRFAVYNPAQINEFMHTQNLQTDVLNNAETRRRLRETLEIDGIFTGEFITYKGSNPRRTADHIQLTVRMISTESGLISYSGQAKSDMSGLLTGDQSEVIEAVVDMLIRDIKAKF